MLLSNFASELTTEQIASLAAIDERFEALSKGGKDFNEKFWTDEALTELTDWEFIRQMAVRALSLFGWPLEIPANNLGVYVKGASDVAGDC